MFHLTTKKEVASDLKDFYKNALYIECKEAVIKERNSVKYLLVNPNLFDLEVIHERLFHLSEKLDKLKENYRSIDMSNESFIRLPKNFEVVNEDAASMCDSAVIIEVFNGKKFNLPDFVYFYRKCEKDSHFFDNLDFQLEELYPNYKRALEVEKQQFCEKFTSENYFKEKVTRGVFYVSEAKPIIEHLDRAFEDEKMPTIVVPAYSVAIYQKSDVDETANL